jgi:hypothetical protein
MAHTLWRKQDNWSGRWTSPDPYGGSMSTADPQSFNRDTYCNNDPVNHVDPTGLSLADMGVYQTENPAVADKLNKELDRRFTLIMGPIGQSHRAHERGMEQLRQSFASGSSGGGNQEPAGPAGYPCFPPPFDQSMPGEPEYRAQQANGGCEALTYEFDFRDYTGRENEVVPDPRMRFMEGDENEPEEDRFRVCDTYFMFPARMHLISNYPLEAGLQFSVSYDGNPDGEGFRDVTPGGQMVVEISIGSERAPTFAGAPCSTLLQRAIPAINGKVTVQNSVGTVVAEGFFRVSDSSSVAEQESGRHTPTITPRRAP